MAKLGTITYEGISGTQYEFDVYIIDTSFNDVGAVYIITKRYQSESGYTHTHIYAGQTSDLSERFDDHHKKDCFDAHGANCVCVHRDDNEQSRVYKEDDLIKAYNPPCNG